jgi:hypothetical protein
LLTAAARGWSADAIGNREEKASASLYSLVQAARANELEPYAYPRRIARVWEIDRLRYTAIVTG